MSLLAATVLPDPVNGAIIVELHGVLDLRTAPQVRAVLLTCLARGPDRVIVDVADLRLVHDTQLTVFPAALRNHGGTAVTMVLCGADATLRAQLRNRVLGPVTVARDRAAALAGPPDGPANGGQRSSLRLEPTPGAPSAARRFVAAACAEWGLDETTGPAGLIISELVSNAVQHAGTPMVLRITRRGDLLHLGVQDHSPTPPRAPEDGSGTQRLAERGRGLHLVATYATAWGSTPTVDGKTVWATLSLTHPH